MIVYKKTFTEFEIKCIIVRLHKKINKCLEEVYKMARDFTRDMTVGSPTKLLLKFATPMLIGNIFQQLYNWVDSIVVGKYDGKEALAAVGATGSLTFLIFGLTFGLSAGASIVVSQYYGAKDYENVRKSFATASYLIIITSIIMGVIGVLASQWLLELLDTPAEIIDQSRIYMQISFAGILGIALYNGMSSVLRALGDSTSPLIFLIISSIINVVLDILFVAGFGWGVLGVAIATIIAQAVSGIACVIYGFKKVELLRMPLSDFKPDLHILRKCIRIGFPVALQNSFISVSMMAMQKVINKFPTEVIASSNVNNRIEQLVTQPAMSLGTAISSFTAQNIGANKIDRAKRGMRSATTIIISFSLIMLPVMYFGGGDLMRLFTKKEDFAVVAVGIEGIRITSFFYSFVGMIFITRQFLSGAGDIYVPMIMGFTEVVSRVVFSNVLSHYFGYKGIFLATGLTWFVAGIIGIVRVISGKWMGKSIVDNEQKIRG